MTSSRTNISHDLVTIGEQITTYIIIIITILYIVLYVTYIRSTDRVVDGIFYGPM